MAIPQPSRLYDTSWTIYQIPSKLKCDSRYRNLLTSQAAIDALGRNLKTFLGETRRKAQEYDDSDSDRLGGLQTVDVDRFGDDESDAYSVEGLFITLAYERATYKAAFCRQTVNRQRDSQEELDNVALPLCLLRMPNHLSKRMFEFLYDVFHITPESSKFSTAFLYDILADYISTTNAVSDDTARLDLLSTVIKDVKLSYSFAPPVAPQLKTLDLSVSLDAVADIMNGRLPEIPRHMRSDGPALIESLVDHLDIQTGLQLPRPRVHDSQPLIKVSKIGCAAFVMSSDGKIKLVSKVLDSVVRAECITASEQANGDLLKALIEKSSAG